MNYDLQAIESIKRVKYEYCRAIDNCDIERLAAVLTEDAEVDYEGGTYRFQAKGRDEICAAIKTAFHEKFVASHTVHMPVIDVNDDGTAQGQWRLVDYALDLGADNLTTVGSAEYVDHYVLQDGVWLIQRSAYTRVYERVYQDAEPGVTTYVLDPSRAR